MVDSTATAVGTNAPAPAVGMPAADFHKSLTQHQQAEAAETQHEETKQAAVGPVTAFKVSNVGTEPITLVSVSTGHDGIPVHKEVKTLKPGEDWTCNSTYDLLRIKAAPVPVPAPAPAPAPTPAAA